MTVAEMQDLGIAPPPAQDGVPYGTLTIAGLALPAGALLRRRRSQVPAGSENGR